MGVVNFAWKLLTLVAVLLMPLGMAPATAAAHVHHQASMPMPHCPDRQQQPSSKSGIAECTMACAAALPAVGTASDRPLRIVCMPERPAAAHRLDDLHPEIATPPPRRS